MEEKKLFFRERTPQQIQDMNFKEVDMPKDLVRRIMGLDPEVDSLGLVFQLTPEEYMTSGSSLDASRKNLREGEYLLLDQPTSREQAKRSREIPLKIRQRALAELCKISEENIFHLGYALRPITGLYRPLIVVPFWSIMEGCKRDTYDQKVCKKLPFEKVGSKVEPFVHSDRYIGIKGGKVVVIVPSTMKGDHPYKIRWENVAVIDNENKRVIGWGTIPSYIISDTEIVDEVELIRRRFKEPIHKLYNFGYKSPEFLMIYPQEIHSHQAMIRHFMKLHNLVPFEMSQYAVPARMAADFYTKLRNNLVIFDSTNKKPKFRKLHLDEICICMARFVGNFDPDETMYWDPERDGRIRDYNWEVQELKSS